MATPLTPTQAILKAIPLPLAASILSAVITLATPYANSYVWVGVVVGALTYVDRLIITLEAQEAAINTASSPNPSPITYQIAGQSIQVTPNEPAGTVDSNGHTVGAINPTAFTSSLGTVIPAGAVYIGQGEWELQGNYYE